MMYPNGSDAENRIAKRVHKLDVRPPLTLVDDAVRSLASTSNNGLFLTCASSELR